MAKDNGEASLMKVAKLQEALRITMNSFPLAEKGNKARMFHEIWMWQEASAFADKAVKAAWQAAQLGDDSLIPPDAELREEKGEGAVAECKSYKCIVRTDAPRQSFDRDTFIALVSREYKIPAAELLRIVERAKIESTPPLTKRIVAVEGK